MPKTVNDLKLLEAAAREFAKRGFAGVGMRDLAEHLGVTTQLLYSRFESKEALYREACEYALDAFFEFVNQSMAACDPSVGGPQMVAEAFFDAWSKDPVPLILTNHDVINAFADPEKRLTEKHYPRVIRLIQELAARHFKRDVSATAAFSFAAITFGYCSLMIIDELHQHAQAAMQQPDARALFLADRKATLVRLCGALWKAEDFPPLP